MQQNEYASLARVCLVDLRSNKSGSISSGESYRILPPQVEAQPLPPPETNSDMPKSETLVDLSEGIVQWVVSEMHFGEE